MTPEDHCSVANALDQGIIRPYELTDESRVLEILRQPGGHHYTLKTVDLSGFQQNYVYINDEGIVGLLCLEVHEKISQIICYVAPNCRRRGIGNQLFEYGKARLRDLDPNTIWLFFRSDVGGSARFYQNRGAIPWYSYHFMEYHEAADTQSSKSAHTFDRITSYSPELFDVYIEARSRAFIPINQLIDSRPHDERERSDEIRKWAERHEKDIWLFFKEDELVGSIALYEGFFDEVFVVPEYQGQGLGGAIVRWALDYCRRQGWSPSLCVVTGNQPAINLYTRAGFSVSQTLELNRLFSPNKAPDLRGPIGG